MREDGGIRSGAIRRSLERLERLPRGVLVEFPRLSTPVAVTTTPTAITGSLSFTFAKGRRFRVVCAVRAFAASAAAGGSFALYNGSTDLTSTFGGNVHIAAQAGGVNSSAYGEWLIDGTGQQYTALHFKAALASGTIHVGDNSQFYIEDVGAL
jgi:hypothetical protein